MLHHLIRFHFVVGILINKFLIMEENSKAQLERSVSGSVNIKTKAFSLMNFLALRLQPGIYRCPPIFTFQLHYL